MLSANASLQEPLRIRYFRADETAKISVVAARCKRQLKNCESRNMPGGTWVDAFGTDPQSARMVSIDVLVRKVVPNAPLTADQNKT